MGKPAWGSRFRIIATLFPTPLLGLQRWAELPTSAEIKGDVAAFREVL